MRQRLIDEKRRVWRREDPAQERPKNEQEPKPAAGKTWQSITRAENRCLVISDFMQSLTAKDLQPSIKNDSLVYDC